MEAASDTTASALQSVILMLVAFPEVQRKAKEEVDSVIGSERTPKLEDWANLPYLQVSFVWRCIRALT
jgi:cytochrome P450